MANYTTSRRQKLEQRLRQVIPTMVEEVYQEVEQQDDPPTLLEIERLVQRVKILGREKVLTM